eukprot:898715-Pleurochrysis_carterae.AAC.1
MAWERRNVGMVAESSMSEGDVMPPKAVSAALSRSATRWTSAVGLASASGHEVSPRIRRKPASEERRAPGRDSRPAAAREPAERRWSELPLPHRLVGCECGSGWWLEVRGRWTASARGARKKA